MFPDLRIRTAVETMIGAIDAPPVPWANIRHRISQPQTVKRPAPPYARFAIAASLVLVAMSFAFPSASQALIQSIEERYRAALHAMGGYAPPPVPTSFASTLTPTVTTLADARSRVPFTIVEPAGLPSDVVSQKIAVAPTGVYSEKTHTWGAGPPMVTFTYHRAHGHWFALVATSFDAAYVPSQYLFEAQDEMAHGRPVIVRRENFAWRNGNQLMSIAVSNGISASEIDAIRLAMSGTPLVLQKKSTRGSGGFVRLIKP